MRNHRHGEHPPQFTIGKQIFGPEFLQRLLDDRQLMMAVEHALAEAGEVFAASENAGSVESGEKFAGVLDGLARIGRHCTRSHHFAGGFEGQIEHRSEVDIEAESVGIRAENLSVLSEQLAIAGSEDLCRRGRWTEHITEAVDGAAFEVDASE